MFEERRQLINLETGLVIRETFHRNGRLHRDETSGPAYIIRSSVKEEGAASPTEKVLEEHYYLHGQRHRENGPALIRYRGSNGVCFEEFYYRRDRLHRNPKEGPAQIERNYDGTVLTLECYFVNGRGYRDPADGPWHIERDDNGNVKYIITDMTEPSRPTRSDRRRRQIVEKKPAP
jgi:hypothetical protein